jgi:hypothetical protein
MPFLRVELFAAARRVPFQRGRLTFALLLTAIVIGTFGAWYYWESGTVRHDLMARIAAQSFILALLVHSTLVVACATSGAVAIAGEMDRQTLGFLLATRLSSAEIVLGKLAVRMVGVLSTIAAGLPVVVLLHTLGGVDFRLIMLAYGGIVSTSFFVLALAMWCSSRALNGRVANTSTSVLILLWLVGSFLVGTTPILGRLGIRLPAFLMTANAWVMASNPLSVFARFAAFGGVSAVALVDAVAWMCGLQLVAGVILVGAAIVQLRPAYRVNVGGDGHRLLGRFNLPTLRLFPKRAMSDDPILWKAMQIRPRANLFLQVLGFACAIACWGALAASTFFFAYPAFVELWNQGCRSGAAAAVRPEFNLAVRLFAVGRGPGDPADLARLDFNLFLRSITTAITLFLALLTASAAFEPITLERRRSTWSSLIATSLAGSEILKSFMLASLWRLRWATTTLVFLWTLGLCSGAIHPLGYGAALVVQAASTWCLITAGTLIALKSVEQADRSGPGTTPPTAANAGHGLGWTILVPIVSGFLPFLLPGRLGSVVWGAASPPFLIWLASVSCREMRSSLREPIYPLLNWIDKPTADSPLAVGAALLIGICVPAVWGYRNWRYCVANFDRLVGRPWRESASAPRGARDVAPVAVPGITEPGLTSA